MGKYVLYLVIALMLAFGLNFFGIVDIPFLDVPFSLEAQKEGSEKVDDAAQKALGN